MVTSHIIPHEENVINIPQAELKWSSVTLQEIIERDARLEARIYDIEGKNAREILKKCKWKIVNLWSKDGLISSAYYPTRFKRIYVSKAHGLPFLLPSQLTEIYPKPTKYISEKTNVDINLIKLRRGSLLITRSGTVGQCTIVNKTLNDMIFSDDVIRVTCKEHEDLGYVYAFLKTKIGQLLIVTNNYGSVINHIEPNHLGNIPIPNPEKAIKEKVHNKVMMSFQLRDESNELLDIAERLLIEELRLPPLDNFKISYFNTSVGSRNFSAPLNQLDNRLDASYHLPLINAIKDHLKKFAEKVISLGDTQIVNQIILPGRFKRTYVEEGQGVVFFGGKQIYELDPSNKKYLSLSHHERRIIKELLIRENMILVTCSGTIGKVTIAPKHWENWTINQHVLRIIPKDETWAGYLYTWLNSDYGNALIKRFTYGAVVDEIDDKQMAQVVVPILKDPAKQKQINDLVLEANKKRYEAYLLEQEAIRIVNEEVIHNQ